MFANKLKIEGTLKSKDTEEFLDIIFYRPFGYLMAVVSKKMGITPNGITIFSIFVGVLAGHLFYYNDLTINIIGIALLIWAEALDSADGQLARMTNTKSLFGRILDGFGGNCWFLSIYIHLSLRLFQYGEPYLIVVLVLMSGISHSYQSAMADYYRNYYLFFVYGKNKSEIDKSEHLRIEYKKLSWTRNFVKKFLMRVYINYTIEQEFLSGKTLRLLDYISLQYHGDVPREVSTDFKIKNKKMIKYYNILTTNTRMIVLFISILVGCPLLYFIFEGLLLNFLLVYVVFKHENNSEEILFKDLIRNSGEICTKEQ